MSEQSPPPSKKAALRLVKGYRGTRPRPPGLVPEPVGPGQESVWDYPRPPAVAQTGARVRVEIPAALGPPGGGRLIGETTGAWKVMETAGAPVYYLPMDDLDTDLLVPRADWSVCEWKGVAFYLDVRVPGSDAETAPEARPETRIEAAGFVYRDPFDDLPEGYGQIAGAVGFYPGRVDCFVDGEKVRPQPGGFYAGWVTDAIRGPIKGEPGSEGW